MTLKNTQANTDKTQMTRYYVCDIMVMACVPIVEALAPFLVEGKIYIATYTISDIKLRMRNTNALRFLN